MRDPLKVDEAYYYGTMNTSPLTKLAEAMIDVGPSPCTKFDCPRQSACAEERVECKAFRFWRNNGEYTTFRKKLNINVSIEEDCEKLLRIIE